MIRTVFTVIALILLVAAGPQIAYVFFAGHSYSPPEAAKAPVDIQGALLDSSLEAENHVADISTGDSEAIAPRSQDGSDEYAESSEIPAIARNARPVNESSSRTHPIGVRKSNGVLQLSFDDLASFDYVDHSQYLSFNIDEHEVNGQIPESFMALDGEIVEVEGFMVPVDVEAGKVYSFILTNSTLLCCFGIMPNLNEWMWVEMEEGKSTDWFNNIPILVRGKLEVGEEIEDGIIISLYRMTADRAGLLN